MAYIYIGNNSPVELLKYIEAIEKSLGVIAHKDLLPMQLGDVQDTFADVSELIDEFNYMPKTSVSEGVENFAKWFKDYYNY